MELVPNVTVWPWPVTEAMVILTVRVLVPPRSSRARKVKASFTLFVGTKM